MMDYVSVSGVLPRRVRSPECLLNATDSELDPKSQDVSVILPLQRLECVQDVHRDVQAKFRGCETLSARWMGTLDIGCTSTSDVCA